MAKLEPVDAAPAGPDVAQVAAAVVAESATAAAVSSVDGESEDEELSKDFQMDSAYTTSEDFQKALNSGPERKWNRNATHTLKKVVLISGVVLAVIGAIFAVSKKSKKVP